MLEILIGKLTALNGSTQFVEPRLDLVNDERMGIVLDQFLNRVVLQDLADGRKLLQYLAIRGHA